MADNTEVNEEGTAAAATLQTKSGVMSGILSAIGAMSHEDMMKWFADSMELAGQVPGSAEQNQASVAMKGAIKEDAEKLFEGDTLTEDEKFKVTTLIESAIAARISLFEAELQEKFQNDLVEQVATIQEEMETKVDQYLSYAVEQWAEKNEVAISSSLKLDRAEKLVEGLVKLMSEARIELPEAENVVESLEAERDALQQKLNEQIAETIAVRETLQHSHALEVFREVSEGLTAADVVKFRTLVEDMEIDEDAEALKSKLNIVKEAHFKNNKTAITEAAAKGLTEITETVVTEGEPVDETVEAPVDQSNPYAVAAKSLSFMRRTSFGNL